MQPDRESSDAAETPAAKGGPLPLWPWIVIAIAVFVIVFGARIFGVAAKEEKVESHLSDLVILQLQVRPVIGIAPLDLEQALLNLEILEAEASSNHEVAVLAATHAFVDPGEAGRARAAALIEKQLDQLDEGAKTDLLFRAQDAIRQGVSNAERQELSREFGWFARLFPIEGQPNEFPDADGTRSQGLVTAAVIAFTALTGILFFLTGAILLIKGMLRRHQGKLACAFSPDDELARRWFEGFAIFMGALAVGSLGTWWFADWQIYAGIGLAGIVAGVLWPLFHGCEWARVRRSIGWTRGAGVFREIGAGLIGYLTILPLAVVGFVVMLGVLNVIQLFQGYGLGEPGSGNLSHPAVGWMLGGWQAKLSVFLLAAVFAPLVEESLFRGALFRALRSRWSFVWSGLISGLIFAAIHPQGLLAIPPLMAMGFGFAMIREWRDSLIAPITAHAVNNGILIGVLSLLVG